MKVGACETLKIIQLFLFFFKKKQNCKVSELKKSGTVSIAFKGREEMGTWSFILQL